MPEKIKDWAISRFGDCRKQKIVRITNKITLESTLFNELRARRPVESSKLPLEVKDCKFCRPKEMTAEDLFGRVEGKFCVTPSNMAKYDYLHAVLIFKDHEPFVSERDKIADFIEVAYEWFKRANEFDRSAIYPLFIWNCLWRAGASVIHGHAQILISKEPYAVQEFYERIRMEYRNNYGSEYLEDLYRVHRSVELAFKCGSVKILMYLTPVKEKEVFMIADDVARLADAISIVLEWYKGIGVESFNLAILFPPLGSKDFIIARLVDRGELSNRTCDIGCMELLAKTSVVSSDPFKLAESFRSGAAEI